jgi:pilus assembly protein CpaF
MAGLLGRIERGRLGVRPHSDGPGAATAPVSPDLWTVVREVQTRVLRDHGALLSRARTDPARKRQLKGVITRILAEESVVVGRMTRESLVEAVSSEILGYGPLDSLLADPEVTDVLVNGPGQVYVEREGRLCLTSSLFRNEEHLEDVIGRIVGPLGRRVDQLSPFVDARLPDGARVNVIIPPVAVGGAALCIRKFAARPWTLPSLVDAGALSQDMAEYLRLCLKGRLNLIVAGGTGSGKTTLLNTLCDCLSNATERIITIEDSAEIRLSGRHVVSLESRPAGIEGRGEVTIRQLVRNSLRMRPDRIVIGEVRGAEAFELLNALNTGHEGSLSTLHANSGTDALHRLENMVMMAGEPLPYEVVSRQVSAAVDVIVMMERGADRTRRVTGIDQVVKDHGPDPHRRVASVFRWLPASDGGRPAGFHRMGAVSLPRAIADRVGRAGLTGAELECLGCPPIDRT